MRGLNENFLNDLKEGLLAPFTQRVKSDHSLCLEIRENYVNIYYRGSNLIKLSSTSKGYKGWFDPNYAESESEKFSQSLPHESIKEPEDVDAWIGVIPQIKQAIDFFLSAHPKEEREAQQAIVRDNNFCGVSEATDYFVCDIEYTIQDRRRVDMVAVHWPSTPSVRQKQANRRLVLIEAKFGDGNLKDDSGIHSHIRDIDRFLSNPNNLQKLKDDMIRIYNQKLALELLHPRIEFKRELVSFSDEKPMLIFVLINHDPTKSDLNEALVDLPPSPHVDMYLATGCFMGYGLFEQAVLPINVAIERFDNYIYDA